MAFARNFRSSRTDEVLRAFRRSSRWIDRSDEAGHNSSLWWVTNDEPVLIEVCSDVDYRQLRQLPSILRKDEILVIAEEYGHWKTWGWKRERGNQEPPLLMELVNQTEYLVVNGRIYCSWNDQGCIRHGIRVQTLSRMKVRRILFGPWWKRIVRGLFS